MAKKKKSCIYTFFNSFSVLICLALLGFAFVKFFNTETFYKNRYPLVHNEVVEEYCDLY